MERLARNNGVTHYLVEYGGMPGESASTTGVVNLTIESIEVSGSTYNIFDDKELVGVVVLKWSQSDLQEIAWI